MHWWRSIGYHPGHNVTAFRKFQAPRVSRWLQAALFLFQIHFGVRLRVFRYFIWPIDIIDLFKREFAGASSLVDMMPHKEIGSVISLELSTEDVETVVQISANTVLSFVGNVAGNLGMLFGLSLYGLVFDPISRADTRRQWINSTQLKCFFHTVIFSNFAD